MTESAERFPIPSPTVTIVILNYNGAELLRKCVESVLESTYKPIEVVVVDNASTDGSLETIASFAESGRLRLLRMGDNIGSAGYNIGLRAGRGEIVAFLNMDITVERNWLEAPLRMFDSDSSISSVCVRVLSIRDPSKSDPVISRIDSIGSLLLEDRPARGSYVFSAHGGAMIVRREALELAGTFDSQYFLFYDEVDLCWRIWLSGGAIRFCPDSVVHHFGSYSASKLSSPKRHYLFVRNRLQTMIKNYAFLNMIRYTSMYFVFIWGAFLLRISQRDLGSATALWRAVQWNMIYMRGTMRKRSMVQSRRRVPDSFLLGSLIARVNLRKVYT